MTEQSARFSGRLVAERRHRSWFGVVMLLASMVAVTVPTKASAVVASVAVSSSHVSQAGEVVTVTGSGFDPAANVGTRPPLAGQPSGFYVVFGRIGDPWAPSTGAASSTREVLSQVWVLPAASRAILDPGGTNPSFATLNPDGSFALAIEVAPGGTSAGDYAIVTYAASGAVNAEHETRTPISFYDPTTTTTATTSTSSSTSSTSTTVPASSSTSESVKLTHDE